MRRERHVNAQNLTLSGTINDTATSLTVNNGTALPSEGDFRISIGTEIMRVTARSANTVTVDRGQDGTSTANHSSGASIILIATKNSVEQQLLDSFGPQAWMSSNNVFHNLTTSNTFSWVNQGTSTVQDETNGSITLFGQSASPHSLRCLVKSAPGQPYDVVAHCHLGVDKLQGVTGSMAGILLRESGTGKLETLTMRSDNTFSWFAWNSPTSFSATVTTTDLEIDPSGFWLKFTHNGTNISAYLSADGINWIQRGDRSKSTFFTTDADQVGIFHANYDSDGQYISFRSFRAE